ncbi:MAG: leucine-rich repeat domain-containing protein [Salinivirgaceae bacterium]|nr:leucine-rich repeat domain-containing protein [Salinivirgaceae bacterium]
MKKLFVLFFVTMLAGQAWAQSQEFYYDALYYSVTDFEKREVALLGLGGNTISGKIVVPSKVEYYYDSKTYTVTSVASRAFYNCVGITSVTIPNSVTSIGSEAFEGVNIIYYSGGATGSPWGASGINLEPDENGFVYSDEEKTQIIAFFGKGDVIIPDDVESIGDYAFYGCSDLTSVTIPNSVKSIGDNAFSGCLKILSLTIPNSVTSIGATAFAGVKNVIYGGTALGSPWGADYFNATIDSDGFIYSDDKKTHILEYVGNAQILNIPSSVTNIRERAFARCDNLKLVTIPSSVSIMGYGVFEWRTSEITICCETSSKPEEWDSNWCSVSGTWANVVWNVQLAENEDFEYRFHSTAQYGNTANLMKYKGNADSVSIPNAILSDKLYYVTNIDDNAFSGCGNLKTIALDESVRFIGKSAFEKSGLKKILLPNTIESIGSKAFAGCENLKIFIPESVKTIDENAFDGCKNTIICCAASDKPAGWSNDWNKNGGVAVWECLGKTSDEIIVYQLETLTDSTAAITEYMGEASELDLPLMVVIDGTFRYVTRIGNDAFYQCYSLESVNIPQYVTSIGNEAFCGCYLTSIKLPESLEIIGDGAFSGCSLTSIQLPESLVSIGDGAFSGCESLTSINIPNGLESIGDGAFSGCNLSSISLPDGLESIGESAFKDCDNLKSVILPKDIKSIGKSLFFGCSSLASITIPESVTTIGEEAFRGCGLLSVDIPNSVTSIGKSAFETCDALKSVTIPNSVTSIADNTFYYCDALESVTIANSVTSVGKEAFANCKKLKSVAIPSSVTKIGEAAFDRCDSIRSVFIPKSVESIDGFAFFRCDKLTIYCEASSKPDGWSNDWNFGNCPVVWGATTAVSESAADNLTVYVQGNTIIIENAFAEILVYDAMGRLVCRDATNSISTGNRAEICVNGTGVYLVNVGNVAKRVIVN